MSGFGGRLGFGVATWAAALVVVAVLARSPWWFVLGMVVVLIAWMAFTRTGQQAWSVTEVGVASIPQRLGSSSVVERNLDRITIFTGVLWFVCIVALGLLTNR